MVLVNQYYIINIHTHTYKYIYCSWIIIVCQSQILPEQVFACATTARKFSSQKVSSQPSPAGWRKPLPIRSENMWLNG